MTATERRVLGDMKAGLTGAKPKLSIIPRAAMNYLARPLEYGADKYARGNYHGPPPAELGTGDVAEAKRLLGYLDAGIRHLTRVSNALNVALGTGGDLRAAAGIVDDDSAGKFPPSMLPDLAHGLASIGLGITCAVDSGLLPADPGRPWDAAKKTAELSQKDDPAAERARVEKLLGNPTGVMSVLKRGVVTLCSHQVAMSSNTVCDHTASCPCKDMGCGSSTDEDKTIDTSSDCPGFTPPGFAPCARGPKHDGPCAHPPLDAPRPPCAKHPERFWCATCDVPVDINPAGVITCRLTQREL